MSDISLTSIEALFAGPAETGTQRVFEWRLIRRAGRPFLLVPSVGTSARASLELYAAQRWQARVGRALLPILFHSPAVHLCNEIRVSISTTSPMIQFLARQSGVPVEVLKAPAIKFGGLGDHKMRLVLLLSDELGRPLKVVKAGLDKEGRAATRREADFLEQLPAETPGCSRLSGRLETPAISAFATDYFPGESPANDAGLERLFYAWLNPGPPVPVETLICWRGLKRTAKHERSLEAAMEVLQAAMAGTRIHSTLHHGDFAPWNLRALNSQNIKPYDWERGVRHGVPAWDWFHFIIQTAILVQRLPVERAAGEVEQLLASPRFKEFAGTAGISEIVRPLMLGYLLNQIYVVKPLEGRHRTAELYDLLSMRWNLRPAAEQLPQANQRRGGAVRQLQTAAGLLVNAFWEPSLNSKLPPPLKNQFARHWAFLLLGVLWLAGVGIVQMYIDQPRSFLLFYLVPCLLLTWFANRRLGMLLATLAAIMGPAIHFAELPGYYRWNIALWNMLMRFVMLQASVLLLDKVRRHKIELADLATDTEPATFQEGWMVILACALWLAGVTWLDHVTPPQMGFLPLYLVPSMVITLMFKLRWGLLTALTAALCASVNEYLTNHLSSFDLAFHWNLWGRFGVSAIILAYLDGIRQRSILFYSGHRQTRATDLAPRSAGVPLLQPGVPATVPVASSGME